jgi:hypothetical protein
MATFWRACCALLAVSAVGLCAAFAEHPEVDRVLTTCAFAAAVALGFGSMGVAVIGTLRLLVGATPGSVEDPLRKMARVLAPHRRAVVATLAIAAAASALAPVVGIDDRAITPSVVLAILALRARHLTWFAGIRHGSDGRVRFAASRQLGDGLVTCVGAVLLLLGLVFTMMLRRWAVLPFALVVPAWFAWALPLRYVTVGRDGVLVARWRERFYPFDGATTVDPRLDAMVVTRAGSKGDLSLRFAATSPAEGMFLAERIRQQAPTGAALPEIESSLASLDAAGGYRVAELPRETLWRIVEAPRVNALARLARR